jgi:plasmid maintenance system antidote protein VapI
MSDIMENVKLLKAHIYGNYGTAKAFAKAIGVNQDTVSRLLAGKKVSLDTMQKVVKSDPSGKITFEYLNNLRGVEKC